MKKILLFLSIFFSLFILSSCGKVKPMDKAEEDGKFHYENKDIGFEISLPDTFEYYQTQRKNTENYSEMEFFVPTSDTSYPQEIQGYGRPITIRFYENWKSETSKEYVEGTFELIQENKKGTYFLKFWKTVPADWQKSWSKDIELEIKNSLEFF
jgi:hypothetical protein